MTPADRRVNELIEKWLASIDLHLAYVELSHTEYTRVQAWPEHDRPTRWVLEVARQKILELKEHVESRQDMGDGKFSESLELMAFLANLVGIQHIQRFIPLADPSRQPDEPQAGAEPAPAIEAPALATPPTRPGGDDTTREMPRLRAARTPASAKQSKIGASPAKASPRQATRPTAAAKTPVRPDTAPAVDLKTKVIADAVRLMNWGKPWHELAELIARIAERPPAGEIRKILRAHKTDIETKVAQGGQRSRT